MLSLAYFKARVQQDQLFCTIDWLHAHPGNIGARMVARALERDVGRLEDDNLRRVHGMAWNCAVGCVTFRDGRVRRAPWRWGTR